MYTSGLTLDGLGVSDPEKGRQGPAREASSRCVEGLVDRRNARLPEPGHLQRDDSLTQLIDGSGPAASTAVAIKDTGLRFHPRSFRLMHQ